MATASTNDGGEVQKGAKVEAIEHAIVDVGPALKRIGALMVSESQSAFRDQKFGSTAWKPRRVPNVFGILQDFADGRREPPARRFEARPVLMDTGRLRQSIAWRLMASGDVVEVGSNLPYAATHHRGGEIESATITQQMQSAIWAWLKSGGRDHKRRLGWLLNRKFTGKKLTGKVSARPIVGITRDTIEAARQMLGVHVAEAR